MVAVTTTGSDVAIFTAPTGGCIVRGVMIYANSAATVTVKYDDRTTSAAIKKVTPAANETFEPFSTPLGMRVAHSIIVNTSATLNALITYVEFS